MTDKKSNESSSLGENLGIAGKVFKAVGNCCEELGEIFIDDEPEKLEGESNETLRDPDEWKPSN